MGRNPQIGQYPVDFPYTVEFQVLFEIPEVGLDESDLGAIRDVFLGVDILVKSIEMPLFQFAEYLP